MKRGLHCSEFSVQVPSAQGNNPLEHCVDPAKISILEGQFESETTQRPFRHFTGVAGGQIGFGHELVFGLMQVLSPQRRGADTGHPLGKLQTSELDTMDPSGHN
jgi:hypothetical protein